MCKSNPHSFVKSVAPTHAYDRSHNETKSDLISYHEKTAV